MFSHTESTAFSVESVARRSDVSFATELDEDSESLLYNLPGPWWDSEIEKRKTSSKSYH